MNRTAGNGSAGRVLVVEDDEGIREMLKSPMASRSGIDLGSFASGEARRKTALTRASTSRMEKGLVM